MSKIQTTESLRKLGLRDRALLQHQKLGKTELERQYFCQDLLMNQFINKYSARKLLSFNPESFSEYRSLLLKVLKKVLKSEELIPLWQEYHELIYIVHSSLGYELQDLLLLNNSSGFVTHCLVQNFSNKAFSILNQFVNPDLEFCIFESGGNNLLLRYKERKSNPEYIIINKEEPEKGIFGGCTW